MSPDPDQALGDYAQGNDEDPDEEEGVLHYLDGNDPNTTEGPFEHDVDEDLLELHTALEAQEAGMM